ncbi:GNAT family N-acetyltransferase [Candidatus Woesearchaeota archaeon]|nr:GNAT family N-acetyltransferase [Candidatus Woesearchaeota archaeon]
MVPFKKGFSRTDDQGTIHYRSAVPSDAHKLAKLYDEVYKGGYPIVDCLDPVRINDIIEKNEHIWMVAFDKGELVGAAVAKPESWNKSYETCRSVTRGSYNGRNIGKFLYEMVLQTAFHRPDCDMVFGYPRSDLMKRLLEKTTPPIAVVGSDGGMHIVSGVREEHLMCFVYNPHKTLSRVVPQNPLYGKSRELTRLVEQFDLETNIGQYPARLIVGPAAERSYESRYGRVAFADFEPSKCLAITGVNADNVSDALRLIWDFIAPQATPAQPISTVAGHVSMYVLADKAELIAQLCAQFNGVPNQRFRMSGYLPAWYEEEGRRYDCVLLTTRLDGEAPVMHGTEELIASFREHFDRLELKVMTQAIYTRQG